MRPPNLRLGLIVGLALSVAGLVAVTTAAQAQFRASGVNIGPRSGSFGGGSSLRGIEPRFQRFNTTNTKTPDDLTVPGRGKGKGKGRGSDIVVSDPGDGRHPGRRPPHGKRPPGYGPAIGTAIGTGVVIGATGPAGAGGPPPSGGTVAQRGGINIPPPNEQRFVKDEVVLEFAGNFPRPGIAQVLARHGLIALETQTFTLTNSTYVRARIANQRPVRLALRGLGNEVILRAGQANFIYRGSQQSGGAATGFAPPAAATPKVTPAVATAAAIPAGGDPAQYALAKLHLNEAHTLANGDKVLVAVIDSGIDFSHPELQGVIAGSFDALGKAEKPHAHGTAIAGAIAAHARLMGAAPAAKILAIRAFGAAGSSAEGTTFAILKGIEYAVVQHARIINMSFAGPTDPGLARHLAAAKARGAVLIAASGNFGPKSPPQYPAADPNVIAVSATDADDRLFRASNIGPHIAVAAPGVDILLPAPNNTYQMISGTSFSAAYVSGVAALVLQRAPGLAPDALRQVLVSTAADLGPRGKDPEFGAGLVDAYQAIMAVQANASAGGPLDAAQPQASAQ